MYVSMMHMPYECRRHIGSGFIILRYMISPLAYYKCACTRYYIYAPLRSNAAAAFYSDCCSITRCRRAMMPDAEETNATGRRRYMPFSLVDA